MEKLRNNKILKIIKIILNIVIVIFVLLFLLVVCLQRFSDNKLSLFNYRMFTVVSGSMEPEYNVGDVLIAKDVEPSTIEVGDVVSYLGNSGSFKNRVITHKVIEIEQDVDGKYIFHTKGIDNPAEDPIVYEDQLYGVIVYKSIILSFIYKIVATPIGLFLFVVLPILYIIGSEIISALLRKEEERRKKA
mgnify:CR=1 FL=1